MVNTCGMMVRSFLLNKPPMVVFVICLFAFAFTTLSLSFYVSQTDKITNPDYLSWNSLLLRISKLEFCLQPPGSSNGNSSQPPDLNQVTGTNEPKGETASISVPISTKFLEDFRILSSVGKTSPENSVLARGEIGISQLGRHLSRYEGQKIFLTFQISGNGMVNNNGYICLFVEGPEVLLSDLNSGVSPDNCSSDVFKQNATILSLKSHSQDEAVALDWCDAAGRNETPMSLEFTEHPDWSVYVTVRDKEMMQLHLLVTSVFIFVILLTVFVAMLIRNAATALCKKGQGYSQTHTSDEAHFIQQNSSNINNPDNVERG